MAKILIVEDDPDLCELLTVLLQRNGFEVQSAISKEELFAKLNNFTPDLILLDILLPGYNGRDICKEIKGKRKGILIILMSANPLLLLNHEECHADGAIEKPFNNEDIIDKIKHVIKTNQL